MREEKKKLRSKKVVTPQGGVVQKETGRGKNRAMASPLFCERCETGSQRQKVKVWRGGKGFLDERGKTHRGSRAKFNQAA